MPQPRRSGRERKANPKYRNDGWDEETLRILRHSSESSDTSLVDAANSPRPEDAEPLEAPSIQHDVGNAAVISDASVQSSDIEAEDEDEDDENPSLASGSDGSEAAERHSKPRPFFTTSTQTAHSRGLPFTKDHGKAAAYQSMFGPEAEDLLDVIRARDTWLKARDITIPSRQTLLTAIEDPKEANWADDTEIGNPETMELDPISISLYHNQSLLASDEIELRERHLLSARPSHSLILGPSEKQKKYTQDYLSAYDFGKAWEKEENKQSRQPAQNEEPVAGSRYHEGWLLNVGQTVRCLAWAPRHGRVQYLAIAVSCNSDQRQMVSRAHSERPAFHPSPPYPSAIQIWAFETGGLESGIVQNLAMNRKPVLAFVLATEWGNILQLKWCPTNQEKPPESHAAPDNPTLGLLGVLSSDGRVRMVAVPCHSRIDGDNTTFLQVQRPGLEIIPPVETIFTTMAFVSPTDLILGASDGSVHLYDLGAQATGSLVSKSYMEHQLHRTYIVALSSASLGPRSTFVAAVSASGDLVLTDLRSPEQDCVHVSRACIPNRDLVYSPFTNSFITVLDQTGNSQTDRNGAAYLVCHHIRRFPNILKLARLPRHGAGTTALAGSQWHPCILVGNAKGQVVATNYLRKVLPFRKTDQKKAMGAYLQTICQHDWRPLTRQELDEAASSLSRPGRDRKEHTDLYHGHDVRPGVSRFQEGFKPQKIEVGNLPLSAAKKVKTKTEEEVGVGQVIFEEEQAVTALEWNPNATCAGIVAMGWGSGIVRVQDLAYNAEAE